MNDEMTIDLDSNIILNIVDQYKDVNADLTTMTTQLTLPNIPKFIDISSDVDSLMNIMKNAKESLVRNIDDIITVLNESIRVLRENDDINLIDFYNLNNDFTLAYNSDFVEKMVKNESGITLSEFIEFLNASDGMFENLYVAIKEDFINQLAVQQQVFREKEPELLDEIIESIYFKGTNTKIGTKEFEEGLDTFKKDFSKWIIALSGNDNVDILSDESLTDYQKALLLLTYGEQDELFSKINNVYQLSFNKSLTVDDAAAIDFIKNADALFTKDWTNTDIKDIVTEFNNVLELNVSYGNMAAYNVEEFLATYNVDHDQWIKYLQENHYIDSLYTKNPDITNEEIVDMTYNETFLAEIYSKYGINGLYGLINSTIEDNDIKLDDYLLNHHIFGSLASMNMFDSVYETLYVPYVNLTSNKIKLDAAKQNYSLALAKSIDVSSVTDADVLEALEYLGDNAKYLEDWQIKTYALALLENKNDSDTRYLELLDKKVYGNIINSKKGYEDALDQLRKMIVTDSTDTIPDALLATLKQMAFFGYAAAGGFYDGVLNSCKGVARLITADGVMSEDDYRQSYLIELLNTDFSMYSDYYYHRSTSDAVLMVQKNYSLNKLNKLYCDDYGNGIFDDEYLLSAKERGLSVYEMLYEMHYITQEEYIKYSIFDERKDDGNLDLYSRLADLSIFKDISKWTYNISSGVGNMAIPLALSAFVHPAAMSAWLFASVTGNERERLLVNGQSNDLESYMQAAAKGLMAVATEKLLGALTGYGAKADDMLSVFNMDSSLMTKFMATGFGQKFAKIISSQVHESIEELVENVGDHLIDFLADGTICYGDDLMQETYMTLITTFATTPLINLMGGKMQNNAYSYNNRLHLHDIGGISIEYSNNELLKFTKDGVLDYEAFLKYMVNEGRINNIVSTEGTTISPELADYINYYVHQKNSGNYDNLPNNELVELRELVGKVTDNERNIVLGTCIGVNDEIVEITYGMFLDSIDLTTGKLSVESLSTTIALMTGSKVTITPNALYKFLRNSPTDIFDHVRVGMCHNPITHEVYYSTVAELQQYGYDNIFQYMVSTGRTDGVTYSGSNIIYSRYGQVIEVDKGKLFDFISNSDFSYENFRFESEFDNLSSTELVRLICELQDYSRYLNLTEEETNILGKVDFDKMNSIINYYYGSSNVKDMLLWTRDELPKLYDVLGNLVTSDKKNNLRYTGVYFDTQEEYINYLIKNLSCTRHLAEHSGGINCNGVMYTFIGNTTKHIMLHEGNHSLGSVPNRGLNESLTESFAHRVQEDNNLIIPNYIAYKPGTTGINLLMKANIPGLCVQDFQEAYYKTHDLSNIRLTIDGIMGNGYFNNSFAPAFDLVLINNSTPEADAKRIIDDVVSNVLLQYYKQTQ